MEKINSMRFFSHFALQIIAIADWGQRYMEVGLSSPVPTFPDFLFTPLLDSHQGRSQVPIKPSQVCAPRGDVRDKCKEAWKWMVVVLQFWGDKVSSTDRIVYGGRECPVSELAEYVYNTINPCLEPGSKITWDDVVIQTPWMTKRLYGMTASQELMVRHQPLLQPGVSSELELILERRYSEAVLSSMGRGKLIAKGPTTVGGKPVASPSRLAKVR